MKPTPETIARMQAGRAAWIAAGRPRVPRRPTTPLGAIRAMCRDCIFDPCDGGTPRQQVEACTSPECPLFDFRLRALPTASRPTEVSRSNPRSGEGCQPSEVSGPSGTVNAACAPACDGIPAIGSDADGQA